MTMIGPNVQTKGIRVETDISRTLSRIIIGVTIRKMTVRNSGAGRDQRNR
ncbi:hypothetical protein Tco_0570754, partial [Tanacetum coccineum]